MRTAVVVPTYNEAQNLEALAARLLALELPIHVVVVDDSSPDGTGELADALAVAHDRFHVVHRKGLRGYGPASREGLDWCLRSGFEAVCTMDADLSHDPDALPGMIAAVQDGADLAIGSRYIDGGVLSVGWGPVRRAVSRVGSRYARATIGTQVHDCTSGFRCYRGTALLDADFNDIDAEGYCFLIELLARFDRQKSTIVELPITYEDRRAGASKISKGIILEALIQTTGLGIRRLFHR